MPPIYNNANKMTFFTLLQSIKNTIITINNNNLKK